MPPTENKRGTPTVGRFAPSPTGRLHLGNMRTAMLAWRQVRRAGGRFILRIEDIDPNRTLADGTQAILRDLHWLGFDWDEGPDIGGPHAPYFQSQRREAYRAVLDDWKKRDLVYPCACSRKDIQLAGAPHVGDEGPVYPGTCRNAPSRDDRTFAWRFRVSPGAAVQFDDQVLGPQVQRIEQQSGDFVVWRNDDWPSYQLAVVYDDAEMKVTDVVRGADLLSSVGRQTLLFEALGAPAPRWHHVPMWLTQDGERLAKRDASQTIEGLRESRQDPETVVAWLAASIGWPVPKRLRLSELLDPAFDLAL